MTTMTKQAISNVQYTGQTTVARLRGTCAMCHREYVAGTTLAQASFTNEYAVEQSPRFVHTEADCPALRPATVATPVTSTIKRAQFSSRCPGCGSQIETGAPLFRDAATGRYISDCCL